MALRLAVGFHFFSEGQGKLRDPKPFSAPFFGGAKGPFAKVFKSLVWDAEGDARLNSAETEAAWTDYVTRAKRHFGFDDAQAEAADAKLARRIESLQTYLGGISDDVAEYQKGLTYLRTADRQDRPDDKWIRTKVASLKGQWEKTETELKGKRGAWLSNLDKLSKDLERDILSVATADQQQRGLLPVNKPGRRMLDSEAIDKVIPYFDMAIGVLLMVGLFTRYASLAGAAFLASVVASQWPGSPGALPTFYQSIEMFALLVLAAFSAGQFGGLDYCLACCGCCRKKSPPSPPTKP